MFTGLSARQVGNPDRHILETCIQSSVDQRNHFVYTLRDEDVVFYVGRGSVSSKRIFDHRWQEHCSDARKGSSLHVHRKIRKLWQEGRQPKMVVVSTGLTLEESCSIEVRLISEYGTDNLCNETLGGEGVPILSDEVKLERNWKISETKHRRAVNYAHYQKVFCHETGKTYNSIEECARDVGMTSNGIRHRLKKTVTRMKRNARYTFSYVS